MESADLKQFKLEKSIHGPMLEWNQLKEKMDSNNNSLKECMEEMKLKEKKLSLGKESVIEQNKKLQSAREALDEKARQVNERLNEVAKKEKQLGSFRKSISRRVKLVESRENKVAAKNEIVEGILEAEGNQFDHVRKSLKRKFEEIDSKGNKSKPVSFGVAPFHCYIMEVPEELKAQKKERNYRARYFELDVFSRERKAYRFRRWTTKRLREMEAEEKERREIEAEEKERTDRALKIESMANQINVKVEHVKVELGRSNEMDVKVEHVTKNEMGVKVEIVTKK